MVFKILFGVALGIWFTVEYTTYALQVNGVTTGILGRAIEFIKGVNLI